MGLSSDVRCVGGQSHFIFPDTYGFTKEYAVSWRKSGVGNARQGTSSLYDKTLCEGAHPRTFSRFIPRVIS